MKTAISLMHLPFYLKYIHVFVSLHAFPSRLSICVDCHWYVAILHYGQKGIFLYSEFDTSTIKMSGYRTDYTVSDVIDLNNATCQQVTTPESDTPFLLTIELPTYYKPLIVTAVLDGDCLDFPATMVYTEGDRSVMVPYGNNPSFCENIPGTCAFDCDCSDKGCHVVTLALLSAPNKLRRLFELYITSKNVVTLVVNAG